MVAALALRLGLPEVVQQRRQAHLERRPRVGGRLDDGEDVLVERQGLAVALLLVADRRCELGQHVDEDAGVPREPQRLGRMRAEQELGELAQPVRRQPAADPLTRDVLDPRRPLAHLPQRVVVGIDVELRDEAKAADDPERVVAEARRPGRAEDAPLEIGAAAERVDDLPRLEPPRDRVDREVAPLHVLLERDLAVGHDLEVVPAGAGRALDARRCELDPGRLRAPAPPGPAAAAARRRAGRRRRDPRPSRAARARLAARRARRPGRRSRAPAASARAARRGRRRRRRRRRARASARSRRPSPTRPPFWTRAARPPRSRPAHPREASRPRTSSGRAAPRRRGPRRPRSSRRSRPGSGGRRSS